MPHRETESLTDRYQRVRRSTWHWCDPLTYDDYLIQSAEFVSPPKWHLAHTSWFFENFVLVPHLRGYQVVNPRFNFLFNSYYKRVGDHVARGDRHLISRPTLEEVRSYREQVDRRVLELTSDPHLSPRLAALIELGINHEEQHQELLLMDIKHILYSNPLKPTYASMDKDVVISADPLSYLPFQETLMSIGHDDLSFSYDNERPRFRTLIPSFQIASRLVTNGEFNVFVEAGGYRKPELWLSDGWDAVQKNRWRAPLYWEEEQIFTLSGMQKRLPDQAVSHLSFYEADAYARFRQAKLPTEFAWELAAHTIGSANPHLKQMFGSLWQWTESAYAAYPGYQEEEGSIGEYNGKFMCNQLVLRGSSFATPGGHSRFTYRNFYSPESRWHFGGLRLAKGAPS